MGCAKNYYLRLLETCAGDNALAQDAVAWALDKNIVHTTGENFDSDLFEIVSHYDDIIEAYQRLIHSAPDSEAV